MGKLIAFITWTVPFWLFVAIKIAGESFIFWSWWWLLLPIVPVLSLFITRMGL